MTTELSKDFLLEAQRRMVRIRLFDERRPRWLSVGRFLALCIQASGKKLKLLVPVWHSEIRIT
jgi:TPP-dependent pyruvate/acetoin dehydrogenase alpha subunit